MFTPLLTLRCAATALRPLSKEMEYTPPFVQLTDIMLTLSVWEVDVPTVPTTPKLIGVVLKLQTVEMAALTDKLLCDVDENAGEASPNVKNTNDGRRNVATFFIQTLDPKSYNIIFPDLVKHS